MVPVIIWYLFFLQMWKRLSQMQRSVIVLVLLLGVLSALYIIPVIQLERTKNKEMNELLKKKQSFFQSQSKMLRSKLLNELEEQNKAKQQVNEIQVSISLSHSSFSIFLL